MKRRLTFTVDYDVYEELHFVPRGFSVSGFVSFMLRDMLKDIKQAEMMSVEEFDLWVYSDPERQRIREAIRESWGPSVWKPRTKSKAVKTNVKKKAADKK